MKTLLKDWMKWLFFTLVGLSLTCQASTQTSPNSAKTDAFLAQFIQHMVKKHHFKQDYLEDLFDQITINTTVTHKMNRPFEAKPWQRYRQYFVTDTRIHKGVAYWQQHQKLLKKAEKKYGVPASVIIAILGVETNYGEQQGDFSVLESLSTLAFNYPSRADFFRKELENFLLMTREQKLNPLSVHGSYAGAIGMPQFMPSSYRAYAVDFSGKPSINISDNHEDAIASIANYLHHHGWQRHGHIACKAEIHGKGYQKLLPNPLKPKYTVAKLSDFGVKPSINVRKKAKTLFVELKNDAKTPSEYWVGFNNFYVISRYNHNRQYVMAVHQLSEAIKAQHKALLAKKASSLTRNKTSRHG